MIILKKYSFAAGVALGIQKIVSPKDHGHKIIGGNKLSLSQTLGVDFLFHNFYYSFIGRLIRSGGERIVVGW